MVGASGDMADFQMVVDMVENLSARDYAVNDGVTTSAKELHSYLSRVM